MNLALAGLILSGLSVTEPHASDSALSRLPTRGHSADDGLLLSAGVRVELAADRSSLFWPGLGAHTGVVLGPAVLSLSGRFATAPALGLPAELESSSDHRGLRVDAGGRIELHIPVSRRTRLFPLLEIGGTFLSLSHSGTAAGGDPFRHRRVFWSPRLEVGLGFLFAESKSVGLELGGSIANGPSAEFSVEGPLRSPVLIARTWLGLRFGLPREASL